MRPESLPTCSHIGSIAKYLGVEADNVRSSSTIAGERVFAGEPIAYSMRKLWVRFSTALLEAKGGKLLGALSSHDSVVVPAVSPQALVDPPGHERLASPPLQQSERLGPPLCQQSGRPELPPLEQSIYVAVSDFEPDRTDKSAGLLRNSAPAGDGLIWTAPLLDLTLRRLERVIRESSVQGVSVDLRMVGAGETLDFLRFLARVRKIAGKSRRIIASVPGEWFCRSKLGKGVFRSALAGFAVLDMLEHVDVVVARCWRDPALLGDPDEPLISMNFVRDVIASALRSVPCWKLAAGFMCGAVVQGDADSQSDYEPEDYVDALTVEELAQRYVVRRRYFPEDSYVKAYLMSRKVKGDFWYEDARTLPRRLDLVNRHNLVGVELFWPGQQGGSVEICRSRFLPLQDFEGL